MLDTLSRPRRRRHRSKNETAARAHKGWDTVRNYEASHLVSAVCRERNSTGISLISWEIAGINRDSMPI